MPDAPADGVVVLHRTSRRARRLTLRISPEGRVTCTRPHRVPVAEAEAFVASHRRWVEARMLALPPRVRIAPGARLPVEGTPWIVAPAAVSALRAEPGRLLVPQDAARPGALVAEWLRRLARARLEVACARHAEAIGRAHGRIALRDPRTRWGSCTARGDLMFSWRLAMAPPEVLGYVAAHEVAHLAHMDHSPAFWAGVARLDPAWRARRDWLRAQGPALLRHEFDH